MPKTNAFSCLAGVLQNGIFTDISISPCLLHCGSEQGAITGSVSSNLLMFLHLIYSLINETVLFIVWIILVSFVVGFEGFVFSFFLFWGVGEDVVFVGLPVILLLNVRF